MKNYDLPTVSESMTLEQVKSARNAMSIDGRNDPEHPYTCARHPEHATWVQYAGELAARAVAAEAEVRRSEHDAAILDCPDVDQGADLQDQIAALEKIPGFLDGTLRQTDRPRHNKILAARSALYARREAEKGDAEQAGDSDERSFRTFGRRQK